MNNNAKFELFQSFRKLARRDRRFHVVFPYSSLGELDETHALLKGFRKMRQELVDMSKKMDENPPFDFGVFGRHSEYLRRRNEVSVSL